MTSNHQTASLYLHFPFCKHKCIYCDFYSITKTNRQEEFIKALLQEIDLVQEDQWKKSFTTFYMGGGTPSLISSGGLERIMKKLGRQFDFAADAEFSFEANPGTLFKEQLDLFAQAGFNRVTIGVQSFQQPELEFLTRIHTAPEAEQAVQAARDAGFSNVGIDLIFGIPGQTMKSWEETLRRSVALSPEHISAYGLTYEQHTPLWRQERAGRISKCDAGLESEMMLMCQAILGAAGYEQYEISNYALPDHRSRHNSAYWDGTPFLGLGPSAHSYDGRRRWWNVSDLSSYCRQLNADALPIDGEEVLDRESKIHELVLLGLRRREGVSLNELVKMTEMPRSELLERLEQSLDVIDHSAPFQPAPSGALLTLFDGAICLTQQGLLLYDSVCTAIFSVLT